jgi:hypothetical protein
MIKTTIIKSVDELLTNDNMVLSDFVDFTNILIQQFDDARVDDGKLVIVHGKQETALPIRGNSSLISEKINDWLGLERKFEERKYYLSEFREVNIIDDKKQLKLKNYIDDLVFSLYFNVLLDKSNVSEPQQVHKVCSKSKYYRLIK